MKGLIKKEFVKISIASLIFSLTVYLLRATIYHIFDEIRASDSLTALAILLGVITLMITILQSVVSIIEDRKREILSIFGESLTECQISFQARLSELENRVSKIQQQTTENKLRLDIANEKYNETSRKQDSDAKDQISSTQDLVLSIIKLMELQKKVDELEEKE
jgi:predicted PurR-regulated permease PerM